MTCFDEIDRLVIGAYQVRRFDPSNYPAEPYTFYQGLLYYCGVRDQFMTASFSFKFGDRDDYGTAARAKIVIYFDEEPPDEVRGMLDHYFHVTNLPPKEEPAFKDQHPLALVPKAETVAILRIASMSAPMRNDYREQKETGPFRCSDY